MKINLKQLAKRAFVLGGIALLGSFACSATGSGKAFSKQSFQPICDLSSLNSDYNSYTDPFVVHFENPEYQKEVSVGSLDIPNGSMLNFASSGVIGRTIRAASALNTIKNPLGLTHSGIVINENPRYLFSQVLALTESGAGEIAPLSERAGKAIMRELLKYHKDVISMTTEPNIIRSFVLESDGSAAEVIKGILPHVHIHDLSHRISDYKGNVYIRPLIDSVDPEYSRTFLKDYLGRPYERLSGIKELLNSVVEANPKERTENVFCSELCACFYRGTNILPHDLNVSNVIPEFFGSAAKEHDLLAGKALADIPLKAEYDFSECDIDGKGCCGFLFSCCKSVD